MPDFATSGVAQRYASALFDLACETNVLAEVEGGVATLLALLDESPDLRRLVTSPLFSADQQVRALAAVMAKASVPELAANFVKLVARNRRAFALPDMLSAFTRLAARARGESIAVVTSAEPLSITQTNALKVALAAKSGGPVSLETHVDPTLIGGLVVRLGSQMIDTSVRTRLRGLRLAMKEAA